MITPAMVPVCCSWHTETETTLAQLFAVSPDSLDTGARADCNLGIRALPLLQGRLKL